MFFGLDLSRNGIALPKIYELNMTGRSLCIMQHHSDSPPSNFDTQEQYKYRRSSILDHKMKNSQVRYDTLVECLPYGIDATLNKFKKRHWIL